MPTCLPGQGGIATADVAPAGATKREQRWPSHLEGFLLDPTAIDAYTLQAYRETGYRVDGDEPFSLKVDVPCAELAAAHRRRRVDCSAYITACNPYSRMLDDHANAHRHAELVAMVRSGGWPSVEGIGQHPSGHWPGETSLLIFGLSRKAAMALGTQLEQNAIVWAGADAVPRLIVLR